MPKNKKGGKKYKKQKKQFESSKDLVIKQNDLEEYAQVINIKGSGRFDLYCIDGKERLGIIRGKLRKKKWINRLCLVLINKWEFQDKKCSIIHIYDNSDIDILYDLKELPSTFKLQKDNEIICDDLSPDFYLDFPSDNSDNSDEEEILVDDNDSEEIDINDI